MNKVPGEGTGARGAYNTARRPGQPGDENENRAGPNPRSAHPTGPHAPYEPGDSDGLAAEKHHSEPVELPAEPVNQHNASGTVRIVDLRALKSADPARN
jgi:hypothetical protein